MSIKVLDALKKAHPNAEIGIFDPVTPQDLLAREFPDEHVYARFGDAVSGASVVVIANNHPSLGTISPRTFNEFMCPDGFVYDYWNHFSHLPASELGDSYFAVGRSGKVPANG
jgi:UDP-N-acetyl-D-mannosaminuronic acid dehydrogenase